MFLQNKTLEKLRDLINEQTERRSGPTLVAFFNELGFRDSYGQGFPSRWMYTDGKLAKINGTPELDKCIKKVFAPVNFVGRFHELDKFIKEFNEYLAFDDWQVMRDGKEITFKKGAVINFEAKVAIREDDFLHQEFSDIPLEKLLLNDPITEIIRIRIDEIKKCLEKKVSMAIIFLSGSCLEGILLGMALKYPKAFNQSKSSPRDKEGGVKPFHQWTLSNLIDTAYDIGIIKEDVKKFSHSLRDFRNYIHPFEQMNSGFHPSEHTARICWQVLKAAIFQLSTSRPNLVV